MFLVFVCMFYFLVFCRFRFFVFFFFFSSRRRHTRSLCDWSSDVCSSDLLGIGEVDALLPQAFFEETGFLLQILNDAQLRSEERRVGKECRSRWWPYH